MHRVLLLLAHPESPDQWPTHISLLAEGLGQSCVGSVASMISLKRVFPTLTASCSETGTGGDEPSWPRSPCPSQIPIPEAEGRNPLDPPRTFPEHLLPWG